jgi:nucleoside-diphosphate-sugar epimerase
MRTNRQGQDRISVGRDGERRGVVAERETFISGFCQWLVVDTRKAKERLGWMTPVSTEQALKQTIRWHVKHWQGRRLA